MKELIHKAEEMAKKYHQGQTYIVDNGVYPYYVHLDYVRNLVVKYVDDNNPQKSKLEIIALLHDIIEDTEVSYDIVNEIFGQYVAEGVAALTKNDQLPYKERLKDSLDRILKLDSDIGVIKLADRICNLKDIPKYWTNEKLNSYLDDSELICSSLGMVNEKMGLILKQRINFLKGKKI